MKKFIFFFITSFCIISLFSFNVFAQCPNTNVFHAALGQPPCGNFNSPALLLGGGTYVTFDVVQGASYSFSTCQSTLNTQLTAYNEATGTLLFYNNGNGPHCNTLQASVDWTANFSGTMRLLVNQFNCTFSTTSAQLQYRQNNNLTLNLPAEVCAQGGIINLNGTASPSGGEFFGPGVTGTSFNPSSAGLGTHTITYSYGACEVSADIIVSEVSAIVEITPVSCFGETDGTATVTPAGGAPPYSVYWNVSPPQTGETITGLSAGTYLVEIEDAQGCFFLTFATIPEPTDLFINLASKKDPKCPGSDDGEIDITVNGGTPPYSFDWSNGSSNEDALGLVAGIYTVTVNDANGCFDTLTATLNDPTPLTISLSGTDPGCFGSNTGFVSLSVTGGNAPYNYQWSNFVISQNLDSVGAGTYSVIVTDANGCVANAGIVLNNPPGMELVTHVIDNSCGGGADGSATVEVISGGIPPFTYEWNTTPPQFTDTATNLSPGSYSVIVTDSAGCEMTASVTISQLQDLSVTLSQAVNPSCNGKSDGSISIAVYGGTGPYSYNWSDGSSSQNVSGLPVGTHSIIVTDLNGCVTDTMFTLTQPDSLIVSVVQVENVSCYGANDGSIDIEVSGGTAPYSYFWSNFEFSQNLVGINGGNYVVLVTDSLGCSETAVVSVFEPQELIVDVQITNPNCGQDNGAIELTVSGGVPAYSFEWSTGSQDKDLTGIGSGTYSVTVTDSINCQQELTIVVPDIPDEFFVDFNVNDQICDGNSVAIENISSVASGTFFSFWDFGDGSSSTIKNPVHTYSQPGTYTITLIVQTTYNCVDSISKTVTIHPLPPADITAFPSDVICVGDTTELSAPSGDYNYFWSTKDTTQSIFVSAAGLYSLTVTDMMGCQSIDSIYVIKINNPEISVSPADTTVSLGQSVQYQASGGDIYTWEPDQWLYNPMISDPVSTPLESITYTVTIEDLSGCKSVKSVEITVVNDFFLNIPNLFTPNGSGMNDLWRIGNIEYYDNCEVTVFNRWGSKVFGTSSYQNNWDGTSSDGNKLSDGTYYYVISCNDDERVYKGAITILR